jgi:hypothetical protein
LHGVVYGGSCRYAIEVKELEQTEAQDRADLEVKPIDGSPGESCDDVIECGAPSKRPRRDFAGERAIALVAEVGTRPREGGSKVDA